MTTDPRLQKQIDEHPFPLLFVTISGAHLYGFASPDSDYDLRRVHLLPLEEVVGLKTGAETIEKSGIHDGLEIDLVTHDAQKLIWGYRFERRAAATGTRAAPRITACRRLSRPAH